MTIPSRPAPPPPTNSGHRIPLSSTVQQQTNGGVAHSNDNNIVKLPPPPGSKNFPLSSNSYSSASGNGAITKSITRHFPTAKTTINWNSSSFESGTSETSAGMNKRLPPPRPPPPKMQITKTTNALLKKPGQPQSVNVLSNLFGRRKQHNNVTKKPPPSQSISNLISNDNHTYQNKTPIQQYGLFETNLPSTSNEIQLISFDSPPSSPTLTQKSNSDCVSVDSFSSDSNFSSPHNGSVSQPESGFEDDFSAAMTPTDPWEAMVESNYDAGNTNALTIRSSNYMPINSIKVAHPVRNMNAMNNIINDNHLCNGKSLLPPNPTLSMPTIIRAKTPKGFAPKPPILPKPNMNQISILQCVQSSSYLNDDYLPMPNCPPPPPPESNDPDFHIYDECAGDSDIYDGPAYGIALYAFDGTEIGDLSFRENEKIYILQKLNDEWFMGKTKSGCEGIFPSNYLEVKVPLKSSQDQQPQQSLQTKPASSFYIKALYNFEAEQPEDLSICENDLVNVLYKINEDWLFGEINNRQGQFPANFLEYVPSNLPYKTP